MAGNFKPETTRDSEIDPDEEIWRTIRYLDPDQQRRKGDVVFGIIWIVTFVLLGVIIFLLHY